MPRRTPICFNENEHGRSNRSGWGLLDENDNYAGIHIEVLGGNHTEADHEEARQRAQYVALAYSNFEEVLASLSRLVINHDPDWPTTPAERERCWNAAAELVKRVESQILEASK